MRIEEGNSRFFSDYLRASGQFQRTFGGTHDVYLTVFTTQTGIAFAPSYSPPFIINNSGLANASGLNPFGPHTLNKGIVWGTGSIAPSGMDYEIDPMSVRTFGFKNPMQIVGWGYDQFGYPAPNADRSWGASGYASVTGPANGFAALIPPGTSSEVSGQMALAGANVPASGWKAGPIDLRWDARRGVWSGPQSVYAARIKSSDISGAINSTNYAYSKDIRYAVEIFDGSANSLTVTGVKQFGIQPENNTYQVRALTSGQHVLLFHVWDNDRPMYGLMGFETPKLVNCETAEGGDSFLLDGSNTAFAIGVDYDNLQQYHFLRGSTGNQFINVWFVGASGIQITNHPTGTVFSLDPSISFVSGGVNTNITELQGLTTPLTLAQGGTGASGKIFVDLSTNQSVSGIKTFTNQLRIGTGTLTTPGISFGNLNVGFAYNPVSGMIWNHFGTGVLFANNSGLMVRQAARFSNFTNVTDAAITTIPNPVGSAIGYRCLTDSGNPGFDILSTGVIWYRESGSIAVQAPSGLTTGYLVILPTGGVLVNKTYVDALVAASGGSGGGGGYSFSQVANLQYYGGEF